MVNLLIFIMGCPSTSNGIMAPLVTTRVVALGGLLIVVFRAPGASEACVIYMNMIATGPAIVVIAGDRVSASITTFMATNVVYSTFDVASDSVFCSTSSAVASCFSESADDVFNH
jgi:hypothetical protein